MRTSKPAGESRLGMVAIIALAALGGVVLLGAIVLRVFFFQSYAIRSASLSPTLNIDDIVVVSQRAYDGVEPKRGDVVIVYVSKLGEQWVKRIVGLPGDRIRMAEGVLIVNGKPVRRQRVEDFSNPHVSAGAPVAQYREMLPDGRSYGTLDLGPSDFDNTSTFVVPAGSYFLLGDNRDDSDDSRASLGYVSRRDIVGKVVERVYTNDAGLVLDSVR